MQFVPNGPNIPERLLQAHEDGRVVFFCGAGISYPAGLPGFKDLVTKTFKGLGVSYWPVVTAAVNSGHYDMALALLEAKFTGGRYKVREQIAAELKPDLSRSGAIATHDALLTLARSRKGHTRLVTTNFDRLFEIVKDQQGLDFHSYGAPLLPVPKQRWDGLVYLHGLLPAPPISHPALDRLVVTSGDFGLSYLTERWAARFVSELFRNYTVCFVGYSIDDPVLRYMMDALAADKVLGEKPPEAFAFGGFDKGREDDVREEWLAKNVTPILYWQVKGHEHLHATLQAWAKTYRDGITGKENIVSAYALAKPTGSTEEDDFVGRLIWALSDKSGVPALRFAESDPPPSLDWLDEFSKLRFGLNDLHRFGIHGDVSGHKAFPFSLIARATPYTLAPMMRPVYDQGMSVAGMDPPMAAMAKWLSRHIQNPRLILWVSRWGGTLSRHFRSLVLKELQAGFASTDIQNAWQIVLSGRIRRESDAFGLYAWKEVVEKVGLTPLMMHQLMDLLRPAIEFNEAYVGLGELTDPSASPGFWDIVRHDIVLTVSHVSSAGSDIFNIPELRAQLHTYWADFTHLLKEVCDLKALLEGADNLHDGSYSDRPSIADHEQNRHHKDWTILVDFARDGWLSLKDLDAEAAKGAVSQWFALGYPLFRRMGFYGLVEHAGFSAEEKLSRLLENDGRWLWTIETQREALVLLGDIARSVGKASGERLQDAILEGPPRDLFWADIAADRLVAIHNSEIWQRLEKCREAGLELTSAAAAKLAEMDQAKPEQRPKLDESAEFPVYSSDTGSWRKFEISPKPRSELVEWLRQPVTDDFWREDDWSSRCTSDFPRTVAALIALANEGVWPERRWSQALSAWSQNPLTFRSWRVLNSLLCRASGQTLKPIGSSIGWWLQAVAKARPSIDVNAYLNIAGKLLQEMAGEDIPITDDPVSKAINHPVGLIVMGALELWNSHPLKDGMGLSETYRSFFSLICASDVASFRYGRVVLFPYLVTLYRVDPAWTTDYMIEFLDWEAAGAEARGAWQGYLWSARLNAGLTDAIRSYLLQTAAHVSELGDFGYTYLQLLLVLFLSDLKGFTKKSKREALDALSNPQLEDLARALDSAQKGAGDQRAEYWTHRVRPFIVEIWPKRIERRTQIIARNFAKLCLDAGAAFGDAVDVLSSWFRREEADYYVMQVLHQGDLASKYPAEALKFLDLTVPDQMDFGQDELRKCLDKIETANPDLKQLPSFNRLAEIAMH